MTPLKRKFFKLFNDITHHESIFKNKRVMGDFLFYLQFNEVSHAHAVVLGIFLIIVKLNLQNNWYLILKFNYAIVSFEFFNKNNSNIQIWKITYILEKPFKNTTFMIRFIRLGFFFMGNCKKYCLPKDVSDGRWSERLCGTSFSPHWQAFDQKSFKSCVKKV